MEQPHNACTLVETFLRQLQQTICTELEQLDGHQLFIKDPWIRQNDQGEGLSCVMNQGHLFEKAGVNFSSITGNSLPTSASAARPNLSEHTFSAMGVSVVIHPHNPYIPTSHANVRFFIAEKAGEPSVWWFGGGFDLTPYYGFVEDCQHWHQIAKNACTPFGSDLYPRFKAWCDHYFYLKHRQEARGIGGLFFDDFHEHSFSHCFALMQNIGRHFIPAYAPIVERRQHLKFGEREKAFQLYRRGRYVEFNLIYDRGTLFGLQSGGRTESILISLPPQVNFTYHWQPEKGSAEAALYTDYLPPRDWIS